MRGASLNAPAVLSAPLWTFSNERTSAVVKSCGAAAEEPLFPLRVCFGILACLAFVTEDAAISAVPTEDLNANAPRSENHFATLPIRVLSLSPVATLVLLEA